MSAFRTSERVTDGIQGQLWTADRLSRATASQATELSLVHPLPRSNSAPDTPVGGPSGAAAGRRVGGDLSERGPLVAEGDALRGAWSDLLGRHPLDTFFTCTFTEEYAQEHYVYSHTSALNQFQRWLDHLDYPGDFFCCAEDHFHRDTPHLHGLMDSRGIRLSTFWSDWYSTRGRARFESPRTDAARIYCTKYALKDEDGDSLRFRLSRPLSRRSRAAWRDEIAATQDA